MDNFTIGQIVGWIIGGLIAISGLIQISPIKLNPWSWIFKKIGRAVNEELINKVDKLEKDVTKLREANEEQTAKDNRGHILRFGDELRLGIKHSKESFDNVLNTITDYDTYCREHPDFKNKIAEINERYISEVYEECLHNNTFL